MITTDILNKGVEQGIITAEQAGRLRALEGIVEPPELPGSPDDEQLRFIGGFGDIFVTIGLAMVVGAIGFFALWSGSTVAAWIAVAITAWLLAEFFTRLRRMALPSIFLLIVFAAAVFFAGAGAFPDTGPHRNSFSFSIAGLFGFDTSHPSVLATAGFLTVLLTGAYYWRFRVPITIAAACAALTATVVGLAYGFVPELSRVAHDAVILACGLAIFALAMRFDIADPERLTRRTDIAFWLHLLAAPLVVRSLIPGMMGQAPTLSAGSAVAVIVVFLALSFVAVLIDRRAVLVSGLSYVGVAFWTLLREAGLSDMPILPIPLTILTLGGFVLLLSAGWRPLRAGILSIFPSAVTRRLPQAGLAV
jgi:hypothetical protein